MTTDIVDRLRNAAARKWPDPDVAECSFFSEASDEITRLRAECEALRMDAERYRWLRDAVRETELIVYSVGTDLDAAIDAERGTK
jgi:hypothetical protein